MCVSVCVCTIWIDVKLLCRGHGSCFPSHANEAMGFSRRGMWTHIPVPAFFPKWQAAKPRTAMLTFEFFPPNELQSISEFCAAFLSILARWPVLICMNDTFHVNNSKSCSEQVCHPCRFDKMTWALRGIPFQVVLPTFDLISEFTHFNLVVRLSKVEQLAFFHLFTCRSMLCWTTGRCLGTHHFFSRSQSRFEQRAAALGDHHFPETFKRLA